VILTRVSHSRARILAALEHSIGPWDGLDVPEIVADLRAWEPRLVAVISPSDVANYLAAPVTPQAHNARPWPAPRHSWPVAPSWPYRLCNKRPEVAR